MVLTRRQRLLGVNRSMTPSTPPTTPPPEPIEQTAPAMFISEAARINVPPEFVVEEQITARVVTGSNATYMYRPKAAACSTSR